MKIIAGLAKGTKLAGPKHLNIRPTENRVKEAIFSIIHFQIQNSTVLDLFAGSGQLALEALSRGAAFSTCVDNSRYANKIQIENFKKAKLSDKVKLVVCDAVKFCKKNNDTFDFVFLDPPYGSKLLFDVLKIIYKNLNPFGRIICEHETCLKMPANFENIKLQKQYCYGRISVTFYEKL